LTGETGTHVRVMFAHNVGGWEYVHMSAWVTTGVVSYVYQYFIVRSDRRIALDPLFVMRIVA